MTEHILIRNIVCSNSGQCADDIKNSIHNGIAGLKLEAVDSTDTVNGHITITHEQGNHQIKVVIYDEDESPNTEHKTTFEKPTTIPTKSQLESLVP